jgi:threonylcarbamoyladenosine tRNA methylthiotransferase MtaB
MKDIAPFWPQVTQHEGHCRAVLKIQDGCDLHCSYCIIPSVRGPLRSRSLDDIVAQAAGLAKRGFCEIVLTGIHLSSYGRGLPGDVSLLTVLRTLENVPGLRRIRLGSLEPRLLTGAGKCLQKAIL